MLRILAALLSFSLLLKSGEWIRIFKATGFFIELLYQTLLDIRGFMFVMATAMFVFGFPNKILEMNLKTDKVHGIWSFWTHIY